MVSGVSILKVSTFRNKFKVLRSKIGLHRFRALELGTTGCKKLVKIELRPYPLPLSITGIAMPHSGNCS